MEAKQDARRAKWESHWEAKDAAAKCKEAKTYIANVGIAMLDQDATFEDLEHAVLAYRKVSRGRQ